MSLSDNFPSFLGVLGFFSISKFVLGLVSRGLVPTEPFTDTGNCSFTVDFYVFNIVEKSTERVIVVDANNFVVNLTSINHS